MIYRNLAECIDDLDKNGHLIRIKGEVDPDLEMAAIHLRVFEKGGPAILYENVKGTAYKAASNLFGTPERSRFIFRNTFESVRELVKLRNDPSAILKHPLRYLASGFSALRSLPKKAGMPAKFREIGIQDLPLIRHWPRDGGAFITLPQVYTEDIENPGIMNSNLGMYRIQLTGNDYVAGEECGLHYQIHRGIGVHQTHANKKNQPLKVSVFIGGPPAHTVAAVMPLPEGVSECTFAGALAGRRFRYAMVEGWCISCDADFVITGEVRPGENKPEGPFGDHLGYYSLEHQFPLMRIHKVFAKEGAIWPFTVVGRPPQEDTAFGNLIHEISGSAIPKEIPGVKEVHAVDAAGVHPLLLAVGSERYTPYTAGKRPAELLTQANRILGTGQLSLAKYLYITDGDDKLNCRDIRAYLKYVLERLDHERDLHFYTRTTMDTLDYSGESLNEGSKLVIAACGPPARELRTTGPHSLEQRAGHSAIVMDGIIALWFPPFRDQASAKLELTGLAEWIAAQSDLNGVMQLVIWDNDINTAESNIFNDYLWITYTRSNPAYDIYGVNEFIENKHWGCRGPIIIDARRKPHHAPELVHDPEISERIGRFFKKGGELEKWA